MIIKEGTGCIIEFDGVRKRLTPIDMELMLEELVVCMDQFIVNEIVDEVYGGY